MAETKYKVKALSDDLNIKSKEVIELLAEFGFGKKSTMTTLDSAELSVVLERLTQNNQTDIGAYFKKHDEIKAEKIRAEEEKKAKEKEEQKKQRDIINKKKPQSDEHKQQPQAPKRSKSDVRVVDTRGTSNVNVAKYDEKLETFVPETSDKLKSGRVKIKSNKTRNDYPSAKNRAAAERIKNQPKHKPKPVKLKITVPDEIIVSELASRMKVTAANLIKKLMSMGIMTTLNQAVDYDTAYLIADEMGITVEKEIVVTIEEKLFGDEIDAAGTLKPRSPVIVVMGHVDHGKTSLLDAIRETNVTFGEAGGITQHIGAYRVTIGENEITFLDTPGHEAFTAMRARGANVTDIAVLVVAAEDGIMPQTVEAINHAKAAGVTIIVAINKMDKPGADPERIKQELTNYDLVPEEWGGDTICVPVSAKQKTGIDKLLDMIILSAEMLELKANPDRPAKGVVIDAKLDKGRGTVATLLVQNGTLRSGDAVIAGTSVGRVRLMTNHKGERLEEAGPSVPVEIMGLSEVPNAGDVFNAVADERMARELVDRRKHTEKEEQFSRDSKVNLDDLFSQIGSGTKTLKIIVKADVQGSAEAVKHNLEKLTNEEVKVGVIHAGVGAVTENDVMLANASNAIVVGFNVRPDKNALDIAARDKVDIRTYRVIYECIEEIQSAMKGMLAPKFKEVILGRAEVRQAIHVPNVGMVAGSYVTDGKIMRNCGIRVVRDGVVISEDKMSSLKRFKDDVREVNQSYECGIVLERYNDVKIGDIFEAYIMEEIKQ